MAEARMHDIDMFGPTVGGIDGILAREYRTGVASGVKLFMSIPTVVVAELTSLLDAVADQTE